MEEGAHNPTPGPGGQAEPSEAEPELTLVIADDHRVVRTGLRLLLEHEPGLAVVAEADDVAGARRYLASHRPQVLILDLNMPGEPSLEAIPSLRASYPDTQIVVLTMQDDPAFAQEALKAGALGFVLKRAAEDELVDAVRSAARGIPFLNPHLGARLAIEAETSSPADLDEHGSELLRLVALGHTNAEIGERLYLSGRTVETHRSRLQRRLGLDTRADVVRYVLDHGLLER